MNAWPLRALVALVLAAVGVVVGAASVLVHDLFWGLPLAILASAAVVWALPGGWWLRLPFAVGWVLLAGYTARPRPEGDYLISSNVRGYLLLGFGLAMLAFSIATVRPLVPAAPPEPGEDPS